MRSDSILWRFKLDGHLPWEFACLAAHTPLWCWPRRFPGRRRAGGRWHHECERQPESRSRKGCQKPPLSAHTVRHSRGTKIKGVHKINRTKCKTGTIFSSGIHHKQDFFSQLLHHVTEFSHWKWCGTCNKVSTFPQSYYSRELVSKYLLAEITICLRRIIERTTIFCPNSHIIEYLL